MKRRGKPTSKILCTAAVGRDLLLQSYYTMTSTFAGNEQVMFLS